MILITRHSSPAFSRMWAVTGNPDLAPGGRDALDELIANHPEALARSGGGSRLRQVRIQTKRFVWRK